MAYLDVSVDSTRYRDGGDAVSSEDRDAARFNGESRQPFRPEWVRVIDPLRDPDWDRLAASHPDFNFFHRAAWARVLSKTYGHKPVYLYFGQGPQPLALVPIMEVTSPFAGRRGVSMPFSDFCQPLLFGKWTQEKALLETLIDLGRQRKWRYFELRGAKENVPASACPAEKYYGHCLDLSSGVEGLFARLPSPVRRAIHKAEKSGLTVDASNSREAMLQFYRLHVWTRRRHGLPPQPLSFFLNIYEEIIKADLGLVLVVKSRTAPVAAAVFFHSGPVALYKFGASDERKQEFRGNNLAMWEGIKRLIGRNAQTLHFGRTAISNDGLRRFKLSWGTEEKLIEYFRFDLNGRKWLRFSPRASEIHNHLFRRLPLAANRIAGALIYPHLD